VVSAQVISGAYCPRVDGSFFGGFLLGLNIRVAVFVERGGFVWGGFHLKPFLVVLLPPDDSYRGIGYPGSWFRRDSVSG